MTTKTHVELSGPFFRKDPEQTMWQNIHRWMAGIAEEGERVVRMNLRRGAANRAPIRLLGDRVADHAIGRVHSLRGKKWWATAVISVNNSGLSPREGRSLMAAASKVEGRTHAFRSAYRDIARSRKTLQANLTEGLE